MQERHYLSTLYVILLHCVDAQIAMNTIVISKLWSILEEQVPLYINQVVVLYAKCSFAIHSVVCHFIVLFHVNFCICKQNKYCSSLLVVR